jgi:AraC-like DNA-binding protein
VRRRVGRAAGQNERMAAAAEHRNYWHRRDVPGLYLLRAGFTRHTFARHTHDSHVITAITSGVEEFSYRGALQRAGQGSLSLINGDSAHTGRAGAPQGWTYWSLEPDMDIYRRVSAETTAIKGTPAFREAVVEDAGAAAMVIAVHHAADQGNPLAADSLLRLVIARLLIGHGEPRGLASPLAGGARVVARARDILQDRMADPPTLQGLADEVGTAPFPLLRAFRAAYGLPPHSWLTGARVLRARALLDAGVRPARAAVEVGFHDQPHLNRHFTRIVGVTPGAYQQALHRGPSDRDPSA